MSRLLRVAHIAESYPPEYGGGAAVYVRDICATLAAHGHDVRVLCSEDAEAPAYSTRTETLHGVHVTRVCLPYFRRHDPDGWGLSLAAWRRHEHRIARLVIDTLSAWRPDIVNYHASRPFGEAAILAAAATGVPVVATLHEAWVICARLMLLRSPQSQPCDGPAPWRCVQCLYSHYDGASAKAFAKLPWRAARLGALPAYRLRRRARARRRLAAAYAYSRFMAERHAPHIAGPVRYIPLGVNLERMPAVRPDRPRTPFRFGFMGGGQPTKGLTDILDACVMLRTAGLKFELHVWGPQEDITRREVGGRSLDDVAFVRGRYAADAPWGAYAEIDVAVMATRVCEPFGRIVPEAAVSGAPSIGPAIGGIRETIRHGVNGLLYRFRDATDLAAQMRLVLTDPGLYEALRANLHPVRDTRDAVKDVERFYEDVVAR